MFIPYKFADGHTEIIEVTDDLAAYILKSDRGLANAERRERYWCPVSLDAMPYEGETVACHETPEVYHTYFRKATPFA